MAMAMGDSDVTKEKNRSTKDGEIDEIQGFKDEDGDHKPVIHVEASSAKDSEKGLEDDSSDDEKPVGILFRYELGSTVPDDVSLDPISFEDFDTHDDSDVLKLLSDDQKKIYHEDKVSEWKQFEFWKAQRRFERKNYVSWGGNELILLGPVDESELKPEVLKHDPQLMEAD